VPSADSLAGVEEHVPIAQFSTLSVGGPARWFLHVNDVSDVVAAHRWSEARRVPLFVLGGGSNVVVADGGFPGLVAKVGLRSVAISADGSDALITAGAGEPWDPLVETTVERGLVGLECLSGIPGSVGGTPIQNVGAYGQEVADSIERVTVYDRQGDTVQTLSSRECRFSYRMSRFKTDDAARFVVCDVTFRLRHGRSAPTYPDVLSHLERAGIRSPSVGDVRAAVLAVRRRKGMVLDVADPDTRSVGSFFMNPIVTRAERDRIAETAGTETPGFATSDGQVKLPAAWLIERSGFHRGYGDGPVGISTKHTLALVNRGGATARDLLRLAARIKRQVADRFGVWLRPEPVFIGFEDDADVEYLRKTEG
jgi:UDP-N-acetylmuramate dehydrogenase